MMKFTTPPPCNWKLNKSTDPNGIATEQEAYKLTSRGSSPSATKCCKKARAVEFGLSLRNSYLDNQLVKYSDLYVASSGTTDGGGGSVVTEWFQEYDIKVNSPSTYITGYLHAIKNIDNSCKITFDFNIGSTGVAVIELNYAGRFKATCDRSNTVNGKYSYTTPWSTLQVSNGGVLMYTLTSPSPLNQYTWSIRSSFYDGNNILRQTVTFSHT